MTIAYRRGCHGKNTEVLDISLAMMHFLGMSNDAVFWRRLPISDLHMTSAEAEHVVNEADETVLAR